MPVTGRLPFSGSKLPASVSSDQKRPLEDTQAAATVAVAVATTASTSTTTAVPAPTTVVGAGVASTTTASLQLPAAVPHVVVPVPPVPTTPPRQITAPSTTTLPTAAPTATSATADLRPSSPSAGGKDKVVITGKVPGGKPGVSQADQPGSKPPTGKSKGAPTAALTSDLSPQRSSPSLPASAAPTSTKAKPGSATAVPSTPNRANTGDPTGVWRVSDAHGCCLLAFVIFPSTVAV